MMTWRSEWKSISNRIHGFSTACQFFLKFWVGKSSDTYGTIKSDLLPQSQEIFNSIKRFRLISDSYIPTEARDCIDGFIKNNEELCFSKTKPGDFQRLQAIITRIIGFQSELDYHFSDISIITKRLVERAFIHLSRSIVADYSIKDKWKEAYSSGENSCEKLGAAHLLLHGIWAFKASAEGERTDLIFGEPIGNLNPVENVAEALVLTEWKIVKYPNELKAKVLQAYRQAKRYSLGILAGFELATYRYMVIVSENVLDMPDDIYEGDIIYRYINIAVSPSPPSKK